MLRLSESASFVFLLRHDYRVGMMLLEQFIRHQVSLLRQPINQIGIILNVRFLEFRIDLEQHKDDGVPHIGQGFLPQYAVEYPTAPLASAPLMTSSVFVFAFHSFVSPFLA